MMPTASTLLVAWVDRDFGAEAGWVARALGDAPFHEQTAISTGFADVGLNAAWRVLEAQRRFLP